MSGHGMLAGQADSLHYTCLMMLFFLFSPPMSEHQPLNKGLRENGGLHPLSWPYRSSGRRTPHSLSALGFNAYVTADLFMKCNQGSRAEIWHICAFSWGEAAAALWEDVLRHSWYTRKGGKMGAVSHLSVFWNNIKRIHSENRFFLCDIINTLVHSVALRLLVLKALKWRWLLRLKYIFYNLIQVLAGNLIHPHTFFKNVL